MLRLEYVAPALCIVLIACSDSSGLPSTFQDCASPPCEVALDAFTQSPGTIPHCFATRNDVELSCPAARDALAGACGEHWVVRHVYGFPGDFYECIYGASDEMLVGARWAPDNHPTQIAGEQLPADCELTAVCAPAVSELQ